MDKSLKPKTINVQETPHSGYHWDGSDRRFFEGWYFRISLPDIQENFAFMYSIDDPVGSKANSGGLVQIIGIDEQYLWRTLPETSKFWASPNKLAFTHWGKTSLTEKPHLLHPQDFEQNIEQGYQVISNSKNITINRASLPPLQRGDKGGITTTLNQGFITNPHNNQYCRWHYHTQPIYSWGDTSKSPKATAGLLSFLPIFDPGWQVLMAYGLATGYIDWNGKIYEFENTPAYSEKNWGYSFPESWFWLNCNSFNEDIELAVTAAGGKRKILWWDENVSIVGIHYQGKLYEFSSTNNSKINPIIQPWGRWEIEAENEEYQVKLIGTTNLKGTIVRVPTENGLVFNCRDTLKGQLHLELKHKNGQQIVEATSDMCGLEVGGH